MKKKIKYGLLIFGSIFLLAVGYVGVGFYALEIEDHYGDLQEIYYQSKTGDIAYNQSTEEFGTLQKNWTRLNIITANKDSMDLYNWVYRNGTATKTKIYRPRKPNIELDTKSRSELLKLIETSDLKLIIQN
jgi:hypothetical protein